MATEVAKSQTVNFPCACMRLLLGANLCLLGACPWLGWVQSMRKLGARETYSVETYSVGTYSPAIALLLVAIGFQLVFCWFVVAVGLLLVCSWFAFGCWLLVSSGFAACVQQLVCCCCRFAVGLQSDCC